MAGANADQVLVLVNPIAGRGLPSAQVDRLCELIRAKARNVEVLSDLDRAAEKACECYRAGKLRALVSVGGDGTVAQLVNRTVAGIPMCVYPGGTGNMMARFLKMRPEPGFVAKVIDRGSQLKLDAGIANGRVFLAHVGCGFDAAVVNQVHQRRHQAGSGHISFWSYMNPILSTIRTYNYPAMTVRCQTAPTADEPGFPVDWVVRWLFVFNLPLYGWGLPLAPEADGTDGLVDVCAFQRGSLWNGLRYLIASQCGWHGRLPDCLRARTARVRIVADQPVPYQLDGDPGGWLPLEIEVVRDRLTFLVPEAE